MQFIAKRKRFCWFFSSVACAGGLILFCEFVIHFIYFFLRLGVQGGVKHHSFCHMRFLSDFLVFFFLFFFFLRFFLIRSFFTLFFSIPGLFFLFLVLLTFNISLLLLFLVLFLFLFLFLV